jgi:hypothetical protein
MILAKENDQPSLVHLNRGIKECRREREIRIEKIDMNQNEASHLLEK